MNTQKTRSRTEQLCNEYCSHTQRFLLQLEFLYHTDFCTRGREELGELTQAGAAARAASPLPYGGKAERLRAGEVRVMPGSAPDGFVVLPALPANDNFADAMRWAPARSGTVPCAPATYPPPRGPSRGS